MKYFFGGGDRGLGISDVTRVKVTADWWSGHMVDICH